MNRALERRPYRDAEQHVVSAEIRFEDGVAPEKIIATRLGIRSTVVRQRLGRVANG